MRKFNREIQKNPFISMFLAFLVIIHTGMKAVNKDNIYFRSGLSLNWGSLFLFVLATNGFAGMVIQASGDCGGQNCRMFKNIRQIESGERQNCRIQVLYSAIRVSGRRNRLQSNEVTRFPRTTSILKNSDDPLKLAFRIRRNYNGLWRNILKYHPDQKRQNSK